jgi:hypothetical protein
MPFNFYARDRHPSPRILKQGASNVPALCRNGSQGFKASLGELFLLEVALVSLSAFEQDLLLGRSLRRLLDPGDRQQGRERG